MNNLNNRFIYSNSKQYLIEHMPDLKTYNLFISHAWKYDEAYYRMENYLKDAPNFYWKNYSVPKHDPKPGISLEEELKNQIRPSHVVLILSGMYVAHSEWILKEIELANGMEKPIIGVKPWGNERIPIAVQSSAKEIVGWNTTSITSAIRKHSL